MAHDVLPVAMFLVSKWKMKKAVRNLANSFRAEVLKVVDGSVET